MIKYRSKKKKSEKKDGNMVEKLEVWWKKSISEGLWAVKRPHLSFNFKLSYWAQFLYPAPLDIKEKDTESPFYIKTPYTRAVRTAAKQPGFFRRFIYDKLLPGFEDLAFNKTRYFNLDALGHYVIRKRFKE